MSFRFGEYMLLTFDEFTYRVTFLLPCEFIASEIVRTAYMVRIFLFFCHYSKQIREK